MFIGVDINGDVKTVIKDSNGDEQYEVAEALVQYDDDEETRISKA